MVLEPDSTIVDDGGQLQISDSLFKSRFMALRGLLSAVAGVAGVAGVESTLIGSLTGIVMSM